jgi:hypothetical protein
MFVGAGLRVRAIAKDITPDGYIRQTLRLSAGANAAAGPGEPLDIVSDLAIRPSAYYVPTRVCLSFFFQLAFCSQLSWAERFCFVFFSFLFFVHKLSLPMGSENTDSLFESYYFGS